MPENLLSTPVSLYIDTPSFIHCVGYALAGDVTYLYREPKGSFQEMVTLAAGIRVRHQVTSLESLGVASCSSPVHCPLAGFVLVGDSMGKLRIFSDSGDIFMEIDAPEDNPGGVRIARMLKFRQARQCLYDSIVVGYFDNGKLYGMQINHEHRISSGWQQLMVPSETIIDVKMSRGKFIDGVFSIHSFMLLGEDGSVLYGKDLKMDCARDGRSLGPDWRLRYVARGMQSIHASVKMGAYMTGKDGIVRRVDRRTYNSVPVCNVTEEMRVIKSSFDEASGEIHVSSILDTGVLLRSRLSKGACRELHRLQINPGKCTDISSSGGLSLVSNVDRHGLVKLTLFNHSEHLVKKYPGSWDASRFVAFSSSAKEILSPLSLSLPEKIRNSLALMMGNECFTISMSLWNRPSTQVHDIIAVMSPRKDILLLYRPNFISNRRKSDTASLSTMHVVMGIFKSILLLLAGGFGLRFAMSKTQPHRPVLGEQRRDEFTKYRTDRDTKQIYRRKITEQVAQQNIDRAPDVPRTRILAEDFWMD